MTSIDDVLAALYASMPADKPIVLESMTKAANAIEQLRSQLSAANQCLKAVVEGPPAQMSGPLGLQPINSTGMRLYVDEVSRLRSQLAAREAEARSLGIQVQDLTNKLKSKDEQIEDHTAIGAALLDTLAKSYPGYSWCDCPTEVVCDLLNDIHDIKQAHADEIARLKSPPEEHSKLVERNEGRKRQRHPSTSYPQHVRDIDALLQDCARWRNALAIHKLDIQRLTAANAEYTKRHVEQLARIEELEKSAVNTDGDGAHIEDLLAERADLQDKLAASESDLEVVEKDLAAYDACLTQVREEMPGVNAIRNLRAMPAMEGTAFDRSQAWSDTDIDTLLLAINKMELHEAANRNAIAVHMATNALLRRQSEENFSAAAERGQDLIGARERISELKSDNARLNAANVEQIATIERLEGALRVSPAMVERAFSVMRKFDCFFVFGDDTLRTLIVDWLGIALAAADGQQQAESQPALHLTGHQVNSLHAFTDGDSEFEVVIQELPERVACNGQHMQAGLYAWSAEYPEEGVLLLEQSGQSEAKGE